MGGVDYPILLIHFESKGVLWLLPLGLFIFFKGPAIGSCSVLTICVLMFLFVQSLCTVEKPSFFACLLNLQLFSAPAVCLWNSNNFQFWLVEVIYFKPIKQNNPWFKNLTTLVANGLSS